MLPPTADVYKGHKYYGKRSWDLTDKELDELQKDINKTLSKYSGKPNFYVS